MANNRLMTDAQFAEMEERRNKRLDRIDFLLEALLQKRNCSQSSFRGAMNSCQETLRQPFRSNHISHVAESSSEFNQRMTELSREIKQSEPMNNNWLRHDEFRSSTKQIEVPSIREQKLLQEEIDDTESKSTTDALSTSVETFPSMEPIDTSDSLTVVLQVSKNFLPSTEQIEEQSIANDSVDARKITAEVVPPMYGIISNSLLRNPHLNPDVIHVSYVFSGAFCKPIIHCDDKPNFALPVNLRSLKDVMIHLPNPLIMKSSSVFEPPLPKPLDLNHNAITNPAPPPEPPDNVTLSTLIALITEVFPSFSTTLVAQKLFDYLPHRNKITWSHTDSMYVQHNFNIFGLMLLCLTSDAKQWIHHILQTLKNSEISGFTISIYIDQISTHLYVGYHLGHVLALDMGNSRLLCWTHLAINNLTWQFLSVYLHWSKNHMLEVGTNYSSSLPLDIENVNSLRSRSVAKGGVNLSKWTHMEKATAKSLYILFSLESALYVSSYILVSLRRTVSWNQCCGVKFGEQFHILRFDTSIEGVTLSLFLTYFKPYFLEPYKPLKEERLLLVKEWILETFANIWFCFNHKCTALWNGHEQGIGEAYLPAIYYTSKDQLVIQKNHFVDLFHGSLAIGFSILLMRINGVTCVEEFESSIDAYTNTLLELLEEIAMVPYFDPLGIKSLFRVNGIVGAVLQKFYIIFGDGKHFYMFQEVYTATILYSYLDFWYTEVFMVSILALPPYWFHVWCELVDMGHKLVKLLRGREVVIGSAVILECNSVKILEEPIVKNCTELEQTWLSTKLTTILLAILNPGTWDPGDHGYFFYTKGCVQFQQWDPGGCSLVHKEGMLNLELTLGVTTLIHEHYLNFNLEDKVDFKGEGIVMNLPNWTGPNKSELTLAQ